MLRDFTIFTTPLSPCLKAISTPLKFPLSASDLEDIHYLQNCFKRSLNTSLTLALSAPQAGINSRFFIMPNNFKYFQYKYSVQAMRRSIRYFNVVVNPKITKKYGKDIIQTEQCKSVNGVYDVQRKQKIQVEFSNEHGEIVTRELEGFMARLFQHQIDHLDGINIDDIGKIVEEKKQIDELLKKGTELL